MVNTAECPSDAIFFHFAQEESTSATNADVVKRLAAQAEIRRQQTAISADSPHGDFVRITAIFANVSVRPGE
jgi:hypothetical protein